MAPSKLPRFSPPGNLDDLTETNKEEWSSKYISKWMNDEIAGRVEGREPLPQFFNGTVTAYDQSQEPVEISWNAFPAKVQKYFSTRDALRWKIADASRVLQDEYLEWSVKRDGPDLGESNVLSVVMTCEGPEYWSFLGDAQPDKILQLYRELNSDAADQIREDDLFLTNSQDQTKRVYDPRNIWNYTTDQGTIAHLIQPANTLSAEIDIAAQATVIRKRDDTDPITDKNDLIHCSKYGNPYRHSDPFIGSEINGLARDGKTISIADPVALYISNFEDKFFKLDKHGAESSTEDLVDLPSGTIRYERGSKGSYLRVRIQIPDRTFGTGPKEGKQLTVTDIYDTSTDQYIYYGAQFADHITMCVRGVVAPPPYQRAESKNCPGAAPLLAASACSTR
ncbi:uncharacterized protein LDX57_004824 [Aspergillus melleus]|uniref:uncharacterized protein n=1 Tax=Aspergillus melleus TaxID=138277 RepID=UPI001E8EA245|nr:uncharacterized protein LDX57_004824 [Aspergillus melleus]KAH8427107.1 hypothetical protein LDX57_004824 [Aspergillus melleus]